MKEIRRLEIQRDLSGKKVPRDQNALGGSTNLISWILATKILLNQDYFHSVCDPPDLELLEKTLLDGEIPETPVILGV